LGLFKAWFDPDVIISFSEDDEYFFVTGIPVQPISIKNI
jgi:hypothetical protein